MKKKDVPQHNAFLKEGKVRDIVYALDESGKYTKVHSLGWDPKNEALKQAWDLVKEETNKAREQVLAGKYSMLKYYMEKSIMDLKLLSSFTGFSRFRIKRHLKPRIFNKLPEVVLKKYAGVFNVSIADLTDPERIKVEENTK